MAADSRPLLVEKYNPDPSKKVLIPTDSKMTKTGTKKGNPNTNTPNTIGNNATDAAANGTVGTNKILAGGNFNGKDCVMDDTVDDVASDTESMMENHDCARDKIAPISVRYGPVRHNFKRSVGVWSPPVDDDGSLISVLVGGPPVVEVE